MNSTLSAKELTFEVTPTGTRYLAAGDGPPVILLHGDGESAFDWSWVMPELARANRVCAPDLPGHGDGAKPGEPYTPESFVRFVVDFLDELGLDRVAIIGNSLGGLISMLLVLNQTERFTSLCLVDSAGLGRFVNPVLTSQALPGIREMIECWGMTRVGARQLARTRALLFFARPWEVPKAWLDEQARLAQQPGFLVAAISALRADLVFGLQRLTVLDALPRLTLPVHLVWGEQDRILPLSQAEAESHFPHPGGTVRRPGGTGFSG